MSGIPRIGLAALALTALLAGAAFAQPVTVAGTVPAPFGPPDGCGLVGDVWTFVCPEGGTFSVSIDTLDDDGAGNATVDLFFITTTKDDDDVWADDDFDCRFSPVCGFSCPSVTDASCGLNPNQLLVFGRSEGGCIGGGYELTLEVKDRHGIVLSPKKVKLGGGPVRKLPKWLDPNKARRQGPLLDDECFF